MLISHRKKFIYTKTVKTASTSVESYFERFCMPEGKWEFSHTREEYVSKEGIIGYRGVSPEGKRWVNHMSALAIRNNIGTAIWDDYFKFCVIRNPFEKLVSGFFFFDLQNRDQADTQHDDTDTIRRFRNWVRNGGSIIDRDKYIIDGQICVDYFVRYEALEDGISQVCDRLGIPFERGELPRLKTGIRNRDIPIQDFYDRETTEIVTSIYKFELDTFGYSLPG